MLGGIAPLPHVGTSAVAVGNSEGIVVNSVKPPADVVLVVGVGVGLGVGVGVGVGVPPLVEVVELFFFPLPALTGPELVSARADIRKGSNLPPVADGMSAAPTKSAAAPQARPLNARNPSLM
ncbi:hypothetical protein GCM10022276_10750 [Sphingomonas limnosediminicola]|uniref:Uncharacterized protein n=1 Tax=Sphingomonas limnosediminicola TaxID=940133 RepID=A0ABP7L6G2_9SPHN